MSQEQSSPNGTMQSISEIAPISQNTKISELKGKEMILTSFSISGTSKGLSAILHLTERNTHRTHTVKTDSKIILDQLSKVESNDRLPLLVTPTQVGRSYGLG